MGEISTFGLLVLTVAAGAAVLLASSVRQGCSGFPMQRSFWWEARSPRT